jgi:magnesium transporter
VALVFLPPTLIGSIYGMNFHYMPELAIPWAYPVALAAMLASAIIPYLVFKWRNYSGALARQQLRRVSSCHA